MTEEELADFRRQIEEASDRQAAAGSPADDKTPATATAQAASGPAAEVPVPALKRGRRLPDWYLRLPRLWRRVVVAVALVAAIVLGLWYWAVKQTDHTASLGSLPELERRLKECGIFPYELEPVKEVIAERRVQTVHYCSQATLANYTRLRVILDLQSGKPLGFVTMVYRPLKVPPKQLADSELEWIDAMNDHTVAVAQLLRGLSYDFSPEPWRWTPFVDRPDWRVFYTANGWYGDSFPSVETEFGELYSIRVFSEDW